MNATRNLISGTVSTHTTITCPGCHHPHRARYSYLGRRIVCKECQHSFRAMVNVTCPSCRRSLQVKPQWYGRRVACKFCEQPFRLWVRVPCPECSQSLKMLPKHVGKQVSCKHCGAGFRLGPARDSKRSLKPYQVAALLADLYNARSPVASAAAEPVALQASPVAGESPLLLEAENRVRGLESELLALRTQRESQDRHYRVLEEELSAARQEIQRQQALVEESRRQVSAERQAGETRLTGARLAADRDRAVLTEEVARLRASVDSVRAERDGALDAMRTALADCAELEGRVAESATDFTDLQYRLSVAEAALQEAIQTGSATAELSRALEDARAQERTLVERSTALEGDWQRAVARAEAAEAQGALLRQLQDAVQEAERLLSEERTRTDAERREWEGRLAAALTAARAERETLHAEVEQWRHQCDEATRERDELRSHSLEQTTRSGSQVSVLEAEVHKLTAEVAELRRQTQAFPEEREGLRRQIDQSKESLERAQADAIDQVVHLQRQFDQERRTLEAEIQSLRRATVVPASSPPTTERTAAPQTDAYWQMLGTGEALTGPTLATARPVPTSVSPAPTSAPASAEEERMVEVLRWLGVDDAPSPAKLEEGLTRLGGGPLPTALDSLVTQDAVVMRGAGRLLRWLSEKLRRSGEWGQAVLACSESVRLFTELANRLPNEPAVQLELISNQGALGRCQANLGRMDDSLLTLLTAAQGAETLLNRYPQGRLHRRLVAQSVHDLGICLAKAGRTADAVVRLRQAVECQSQVVAGADQTPHDRSELERMQRSLLAVGGG